MNNKYIKEELLIQIGIFLMCSLITSYFLHFTTGLFFGLLLYFPTTFLVLTIREFRHKFSRRPQNIFLLFITLISIVITSNFMFVANEIQSILTPFQKGWTIYPPLTNSPPETPRVNLMLVVLPAIAFLSLLVVITFVTLRQIFKRTKRTPIN